MSKRNVLVITFWSYNDALVQTYTLPYVKMIREILPSESKIFIVTFEQTRIALSPIEIEEVNAELTKKNITLIPFPYKKFGIKKLLAAVDHLFAMARLIGREKISTIHAFGPNAGSFGFLLSKITGKELVIDSFEPHAEAMVENGTWKKWGGAYMILNRMEKWQAKRAKHLIGTTEGMRQYAKDRYGLTPKSFYVKPACVNTEVFYPREKNKDLIQNLGLGGKIICVYAGKLGGIYLKEEVFDFLKACYEFWGDRFRCVMATNAKREEIEEQLKRTNIPGKIVISKFVSHDEVPLYLSLGDFAINPVKPVPTKRYCTSVKDGEYWAMGLPVVITPNISDDSDIIKKYNIGTVLESLDANGYSKAIHDIDNLVKENNKEEIQKSITVIAKKFRSFSIAEEIYRKIYS